MKKLFLAILTALIMISCSTTAEEMNEVLLTSADDIVYESSYEELTLYLRDYQGSYTLSIPEQLVYFLPVERAEDGSLSIPELGIIMEGTLPGELLLRQGRAQLSLDFKIASLDGADFFTRRQEKELERHKEEEHRVRLADGGYLSSSLVLAGEERSDTVILLLSGSGIQDRYETIANHRPFYVLSEYLASCGYDVFLYDDRGAGESSPAPASSDIYTLKSEAISCYDYLSALGYEKIILLGHSQGGNIAAMVQLERKAEAVIMLATPAITGLETVLDQNRRTLSAAGVEETGIINAQLSLLQILRYLIDGKSETAEEMLASLFGEAAAEAQIEELSDSSYLTYLSYDPMIHLTHLTCPVLALQGTYDTQLPPELNSLPMLTALQSSGVKYVYTELDGINHLMQRAPSGAVTEYGTIEETIAPEVLEAITQFLEANI